MSTTKSRKAKGRNHQQTVAKMIAEKIGVEEDDVISRSMGSAGEDIQLSPLARHKFPFSVECKATKIFPSSGALDQSRANSKDYTPCVIWKPPRKNSSESLIYFRLDEFLELWEKIIRKEIMCKDE